MDAQRNVIACCMPKGCRVGADIDVENDDLSNVVKVICDNDSCPVGEYMHKACFTYWENGILVYVRSSGKVRNWSAKMRMQNLWTKKGFDIAYKACGCKCNKGHMRKDLDWKPPSKNDDGRKKKNRKKKNDKPALNITPIPRSVMPFAARFARQRTSSVSSTGTTVCSPPASTAFDPSSDTLDLSAAMGFLHLQHGDKPFDSPSSPTDVTGAAYSSLHEPLDSPRLFTFPFRDDFSIFSLLPKHKYNGYNIKLEDDIKCVRDDIHREVRYICRSCNIRGISCVFCHNYMTIYEQYPLLDGTLFKSPIHYSDCSVPINLYVGEMWYLNAICLACLVGCNTAVICKGCHAQWDGSNFVVGTMYNFDIISSKPCCFEHYRCKHCSKLVVPGVRLLSFSDYSNSFVCPYCFMPDYHYVKPLSFYLIQYKSSFITFNMPV